MNNSGYQAEVVTLCGSEWAALLDLFQDANIYQSWSYGAVRWGEKNLSHLVLRRHGAVVGIAQLRILRSRWFGSGIAYVRWGPLCHLQGTELGCEVFHRMAMAMHTEFVRKRRLFLRIQPDAFVGSQRAQMLRAAFAPYARFRPSRACSDRTLLLDLWPPLEELRKSLDQKWRNQLNRAEKNGLSILEGDGMELYGTFLEIYRQMWARKRFEEGVDVNEFGRIQESLPKARRMKILICVQHSTPVAGIVVSSIGNTAIYLLGATSDPGLKAKGAYLLHWTIIRRLKESGIQHYDLGGIDPERNPGVYHFKRGLSGRDVSRLGAIESCESFLGSICMKAADVVRGARGAMDRLRNWGGGVSQAGDAGAQARSANH